MNERNTGEVGTAKFFCRHDKVAFWVSFIAALVIYVWTLAPTVSLEDSGELAVAADYLGIPHPPGYPLWTILGWVFARLFFFMRYSGQPNPAWGIGFMSAFFGALASGISALLICRSGRDMLDGMSGMGEQVSEKLRRLICCAGGIAGSLLFALSPVMWSQAVIIEVYTLNAFFVALILMLAYVWLKRPSDRVLYAIALAFGLGLANWYPSVLLTFGPLVLLVLLKDRKLAGSFMIAGLPIFLMLALNVLFGRLAGVVDELTNKATYGFAGKWLWTAGPHAMPFFSGDDSQFWMWVRPFWIYLAINCIVLALTWFYLPRGRTVALAFLLVEVGLLVYLYMPIASEVRNPPMNWGYPRTWEGFMHAVNRRQYPEIAPTRIFTWRFVEQVGSYLTELRGQFTLPAALLGFLPFAAWSLQFGKKRYSAFGPSLILVGLSVPFVLAGRLGAAELRVGPWRIYMILLAPVLASFVIGATVLVLGMLIDLCRTLKRGSGATLGERIVVMLFLAAVGAVFLVYEFNLLRQLRPDTGLAMHAGFLILFLALAPLAGAGYVARLMLASPELRFDVDVDSRRWVILTVLCFFLMGIVMVVGANPRGDILDSFIQRVKFISSHALYAFWIGYGLILALAFVAGRFAAVARAGVVLCVLLPIYPLVQNAPFCVNALNRELLRVAGASSQRKVDYGWQFGNYQLRGAEAILEELGPDCGLPDATYPPAMERSAIFFGGTDPGRFVPTYMIFSARVRTDVYLITQNALADHTYMSVMRDLYGDEIWIPAQHDASLAFEEYFSEVQAGRAPGMGGHQGRGVVKGPLQVMHVNGILCRQMHEKNKAHHAFYVEESYLLPWMYPYMEPHGLILKLNAEPLEGLSSDVVSKDRRFWDWYSERLLADDKFLHDISARKSFSKLRGAIAGLYDFRGMYAEAEYAYLQSESLWPLSPEVADRLSSMYTRLTLFDKAAAVVERFGKRDPDSKLSMTRGAEIERYRALVQRAAELVAQLQAAAPSVPIQSVLELAEVYRQLGNINGFAELIRSVLDNKDLDPEIYLDMARVCSKYKLDAEFVSALELFLTAAPPDIPAEKIHQAISLYAGSGRIPEAAELLHRLLERTPGDAEGWYELGVMYYHTDRPEDGRNAFRRALAIPGAKARERFPNDPRMKPWLTDPELLELLVPPSR